MSCSGREAAVFEDDFAGGAGAQAELVFLLAAAEAGGAFFDGEGGDAVLRGGAIGDRHGHAEIGVVGVGGEGLRPVEHPHAVFEFGVGARAGGVAAGFGLGQRPAAQPLAGGQFGKIAPPLLVGAHLINVVGAERRMGGHDDAHRAIHAREFFNDDGVLDVAQPGAAEFFREDGAHVAELAEFADDFEGNVCASSHSMTWGAISASANSRTALRSWICSGVYSKSTAAP